MIWSEYARRERTRVTSILLHVILSEESKLTANQVAVGSLRRQADGCRSA